MDRQLSSASTGALDEVFALAYEELRRLARTVRRSDPGASITPTALVNEAWIKLSQSSAVIAPESAIHFKRIVARAMRQVLVDSARRRHAEIRGGNVLRVTFDESLAHVLVSDRDVLALDTALNQLASLEPRQAALVEARFFGGLEMSEVATLLGISESTALRDWRAAKAWLSIEVRRQLHQAVPSQKRATHGLLALDKRAEHLS